MLRDLHVRSTVLALFVCLAAGAVARGGSVVFSDSGANAAAIQDTVDAFRAQLGNPNNANDPPQPSGRREISWDGGGAAAPVTEVATPGLTFLARGFIFQTPGSGFQFSGQPNPEFGNLNPTYPSLFAPFSAPRLFTPIGSNVTDGVFTEPGNADLAATVSGFGAVFIDVDLAGTSSIEYFDLGGTSLGKFDVPNADGDETLSFLGVFFDAGERVGRVRLISGNATIGGNDSATVDNVVMDDFLFNEPVPIPLPLGVWAALTTLLPAASLIALRQRAKRTVGRPS